MSLGAPLYRGNIVRGIDEMDQWLQHAPAEVLLQPELPIIDAHHHLMDHENPDIHYLSPEFLADVRGGHRVLASVLVESRTRYRVDGRLSHRPLGEIEFGRSVAQQHVNSCCAVAAALVGRVDLLAGAEVPEVLSQAIEISCSRLKSIRHPATYHDGVIGNHIPTPSGKGLLASREFRSGYAWLEHFGLAFDAWVFHSQLGELEDLAKAFPHVPVVLNHLGGILGVDVYHAQREEVLAAWRVSMGSLSRLPNVWVKLGGLGMPMVGFGFERRRDPPHSQELAIFWRPYVEYAIEIFGPERCMFESNFPIDRQSFSYQSCWNAFKLISQQYSQAERLNLFYETCRSFYSIPLDTAKSLQECPSFSLSPTK